MAGNVKNKKNHNWVGIIFAIMHIDKRKGVYDEVAVKENDEETFFIRKGREAVSNSVV